MLRPSMDENYWDCSVCTYRNGAEAFKCAMCDVRKGTSTRYSRTRGICLFVIISLQRLENGKIHFGTFDFTVLSGLVVKCSSRILIVTRKKQ